MHAWSLASGALARLGSTARLYANYRIAAQNYL